MLQQLSIRNLTVFHEAHLDFGKHLNVIIGKNGGGKTHLLKLAYSVLASSAECRKTNINADTPTKGVYQTRLANKLVNVFRPDSLGRLVSRRQGRARFDIELIFDSTHSDWDVSFGFATNSKSEVDIIKLPCAWVDVSPVYLPTRELLSIYSNFISVYEGHYLTQVATYQATKTA